MNIKKIAPILGMVFFLLGTGALISAEENRLELFLGQETGMTGADLEALRPVLSDLEREKADFREVARTFQAGQKAQIGAEEMRAVLQTMAERIREGDTVREARQAAIQTMKRAIREGRTGDELRARERVGRGSQEMTGENIRNRSGEGGQAWESERETLREETKGGKYGGNSNIPESPTPHENKNENGGGHGQESPNPNNGQGLNR